MGSPVLSMTSRCVRISDRYRRRPGTEGRTPGVRVEILPTIPGPLFHPLMLPNSVIYATLISNLAPCLMLAIHFTTSGERRRRWEEMETAAEVGGNGRKKDAGLRIKGIRENADRTKGESYCTAHATTETHHKKYTTNMKLRC